VVRCLKGRSGSREVDVETREMVNKLGLHEANLPVDARCRATDTIRSGCHFANKIKRGRDRK